MTFIFCRFLVTAFHGASEMKLIDKLQLIAVELPKFPSRILDIPCADVFLEKFSDSYIDRQDLSIVIPESDQESELLRDFSLYAQCVEVLRTWRKNCKEKANYRLLLSLPNTVILEINVFGFFLNFVSIPSICIIITANGRGRYRGRAKGAVVPLSLKCHTF